MSNAPKDVPATQPPQPGDLVEVTSLPLALMLTCWPYGLVVDTDPRDPNRVYVAMVGDHVNREGNGAGCRVFLGSDLTVVHRGVQS